MQAKDVMTRNVVSVQPETPVSEIAGLLLERRISAVPVVNPEGTLVGIVSEGDLMRRAETGTEGTRSWWLALFTAPEDTAANFVKTHGGHARDVMTRNVITAGEDTELSEIAELLERHHIKRVPIVRDGKPVGIVSRANLLHGLVSRERAPSPGGGDEAIRDAVMKAVRETGAREEFINIVVSGGTVHIWGAVESVAEQNALRIAAENTAGVKEVIDHTGTMTPNMRAMTWA